MSGKWDSTCQTCGLILPARALRCPRCGVSVTSSNAHNGLPGSPSVGFLDGGVSGSAANALFLGGEQQAAERPFNVVLSVASEVDEEDGSLSSVEASLPLPSTEELQTLPIVSTLEDALPFQNDLMEPMPSTSDVLLPTSQTAPDDGLAHLIAGQRRVDIQEKPVRREAISLHWASPGITWVAVMVLALIFGLIFFFAKSASSAGSIAPDWGLASLRIGLVAALLSISGIIAWFLLWRAHVQAVLARVGVFTLVLIVIGAAGLLSASPLRRLQGQWFEARGQYGLALGAYQLSGDTIATNPTMARIAIEWAEELSAHQQFGDAVAQLQPVVAAPAIDETLAMRARQDIVADYLAWGNQAQQRRTFRVALARYQVLGQAPYCDTSCESQVHTANAQALLGLAEQLTDEKQYAQAVATYQQLVSSYSDTSEGQEARTALSLPQPLQGRLIYPDGSAAANFQVLLASQWTFDSSTQVLKLAGQQYQARTDGTGAFSITSVAVVNTYMIAWIDTGGQSGTCITTNNQPLYTVQAQPLRATDAGTIDVECAQA